MLSQAFDLLGHPVSGERLQGLDDAGMQRPPPLLQEAPVGHLVGEGMFKGIDMVGKELRLIEELCRLQVGEASLQSVPG